MARLLLRAHWLSLDVVAGACLTYCAAARLPAGSKTHHWPTLLVLGAVVFIIYTTDRLLDNAKTPRPNTPRHQFQFANRKILAQVSLGLAAASVVVLIWIPPKIIQMGFVLAVLTGCYLYLVFKIKQEIVFKELFIAVVYTLGVWGAAQWAQDEISWEVYVLAGVYWLMALQNLLLLAWFEAFETDGSSLAQHLGQDVAQKCLKGLFWLVAIGCLYVAVESPHRYCQRFAVISFFMACWLAYLKTNPPVFLSQERYRWLADAVFLMPLLLL